MSKQTYIYQASASGATIAVGISRELEQSLRNVSEDYGWYTGHFTHYLLTRGLERFMEAPVTEAEVGIAYAADDMHEKA